MQIATAHLHEIKSPKTIGYICLFSDIPSDNNNDSLYLQIKYLKEKKGCQEVFCDCVKDSKKDDWYKRPIFNGIIDSMKPNDRLFVLKPIHDELIKIVFKEQEGSPLIHDIDSIEKLSKEIST